MVNGIWAGSVVTFCSLSYSCPDAFADSVALAFPDGGETGFGDTSCSSVLESTSLSEAVWNWLECSLFEPSETLCVKLVIPSLFLLDWSCSKLHVVAVLESWSAPVSESDESEMANLSFRKVGFADVGTMPSTNGGVGGVSPSSIGVGVEVKGGTATALRFRMDVGVVNGAGTAESDSALARGCQGRTTGVRRMDRASASSLRRRL